MRLNKKRLLVAASGMTALGAAATLVAGVTFGFFSATTTPSTSTLSAGTVTLDNSTSSTTCTVSDIAPGDSSSGYTGVTPGVVTNGSSTVTSTGTAVGEFVGWSVTSDAAGDIPPGTIVTGDPGGLLVLSKNATGTSPGSDVLHLSQGNNSTGSPGECTVPYDLSGSSDYAWLAVDVTYYQSVANSVPTAYTQTTAGTPTDLIDGHDGGLQLQVMDSNDNAPLVWNNSSLQDTSGNPPATLPPAGTLLSPVGVKDILLNRLGEATKSQTGTVKLDWSLPAGVGNAYQGSSVTFTVTVHAVQIDNNPTAGNTAAEAAPGYCNQGVACSGGEIPNWS